MTVSPISIHAPQWGATTPDMMPSLTSLAFQSTHPSGVRRPGRGVGGGRPRKFQSTHPSGVRRVRRQKPSYGLPISIHAPQWGATYDPQYGDPYYRISIHAPQWGATLSHTLPASARTYFNPRTPVGCDVAGRHSTPSSLLFQSTHPSGVRRSSH